MDMEYIFLLIVTLALGLGSQAYIKGTYAKWKEVPNSFGLTGYDAARRMLDAEGLYDVEIVRENAADLSDFYDPRSDSLHLSAATYDGRSVAAISVACHEAGHAVQHARNYIPVKLRGAVLPLAQLGSNLWIFVLMAGMVLQMLSLVYVGIALFAFAVVFQIVTLPVEFDASRRAIQNLEGSVSLPDTERRGARAMLTSAALTYVAAALSSILMLLYYLNMARR